MSPSPTAGNYSQRRRDERQEICLQPSHQPTERQSSGRSTTDRAVAVTKSSPAAAAGLRQTLVKPGIWALPTDYTIVRNCSSSTRN